jgi:TRAP-type uncharacterized transport system fused permease subunit
MVVFWLSMDAAVTPPVCITAYVASGIAGGKPLLTGLNAWKMAKSLYIIPFLMVYTDLLSGEIIPALIVAVPGILGIFCITSAWEGYFLRRLYPVERILFIVSSGLLFYPNHFYYAGGLAAFCFLLLTSKFLPGPLTKTSEDSMIKAETNIFKNESNRLETS